MSVTRPAVIGVAGGTCSGKSTFSSILEARLGAEDCSIITGDSYYRESDMTGKVNIQGYNFEHPSAIDLALLHEHLRRLIEGQSVRIPTYDRQIHRRGTTEVPVSSKRFIIVEGHLILWDRVVRGLLSKSFFLDVEPDIRSIRRLRRDVLEFDVPFDEASTYYLDVVRPMHLEFVEPFKHLATIVLQDGRVEEKAERAFQLLALPAAGEARRAW